MKYYYTDPLAAAWMSKHFGMMFEWDEPLARNAPQPQPRQIQTAANYIPLIWDIIEVDKMNSTPERYYAHVDSLSLFELQKGDIVVMTPSSLNHANIKHLDHVSFDHGEPYPHMVKMMQLGGRIIQRAGIAFMWPEVEE